jgi:hypothetical protein
MIGSAIQFALALLFIWIAIFVFWRNYRIDKFRDELFALRNELFDYAAKGGVSFDEPAYGILRNTMNGLLRYAERISFMHTVLANTVQRLRPNPVYAKMFQMWPLALNRLEEPQRDAIQRFNARLRSILIQHVVTSSPLPMLFVIVYAFVSFLYKLFHGVERQDMESKLKPSMDIVEAQALEAQTVQMKLAAA